VPIHPTAVVDSAAAIDPSATVGPFVVIEGPVRVGPRTRLMPFCYLTGRTELGADNVVHAGAVLGDAPQDLAYRGAPTGLRIGDRNVFRESCEIHRGTQPDTFTEIGDDNYVMAHAHVAHNCRVGSRTIVASGALLAGHVLLEDDAFVSGNCVVHQHVRIGRLAILRGLSRTSRDVPPFAIMDGTHTVRGLNRVGLRRAGFDRARIRALATAFRILFRVRTPLGAAIARVEAAVRSPDVDYLLAFLRASRRGVAMGPPARGAAPAAPTEDEEDA
jgi:UDP-N-acetylglucosamine acyltransferase